MKRLLYILYLICSVVSASYGQGNTLTVQHLGTGNIYLVRYILFRDCSGIAAPNQVTIHYDFNGIPHDSLIVQVTKDTIWNSTFCPMTPPTNCANGIGVEKYTYEGLVTLQNVGIYKFYRKRIVLPFSTIPPSLSPADYIYVEAKLSVGSLFQNSLPEFTSSPEFYFPAGASVIYHSFATDIDGDSIIYSIAPLMVYDSASQGPVSYNYVSPNSPYTFMLSMPPATINMWTGAVAFTPSIIAHGAMVIKADEYRNGVWIGSVMRQSEAMVTMGCVTGIEELKQDDHVVFPNPALDEIKITLKNVVAYTITDMSGRLLQAGVPRDQTIDISLLKEGVYILSARNNAGISSCKLIKTE
jgi:hypothetical protein